MNLVVLSGPAVKECGKMISELEALGYEPFLVMLLETHTRKYEHMNMWKQMLTWCKCIVARENHVLEYFFLSKLKYVVQLLPSNKNWHITITLFYRLYAGGTILG